MSEGSIGNASFPESISKSTAANANTSVCAPTRALPISYCSGGAYPRLAPATVRVCLAARLGKLNKAEVGHLHGFLPRSRRNQNVRRLQVAVDDAMLMTASKARATCRMIRRTRMTGETEPPVGADHVGRTCDQAHIRAL